MDASTLSSHEEDAKRLRALFVERSKLSQMAFGERYELGSQGMVSQYLLGKRPLNIDAAMKFAEGLGCTIDDISPSLAKKINRARHYVVTKTDEGLPAPWRDASEEAKEVARYVLADPSAPPPPWLTNELRYAAGSLLYAALRWLREGGEKQEAKKIAA